MAEPKAKDVQPVDIEQLYQAMLHDLEVSEAATQAFIENFKFYGKTLKEHSRDLYIEIPDKPSPEEYRDILLQIARNIQIVSHYLSVASTIANALSTSSNVRKADLMRAIAKSYEDKKLRRPGQLVIEKMAESYLSSATNTKLAAKVIKDYWKQKLESLIEVRKCMEQFGISMHSEMKYLEA